jgi:hypothetical protein
MDKGKILDGFVAATGYDRKHAIQLMNSTAEPEKPKKRLASQKYDEQTRQVLYSVWYTANQTCSKRLAPFLPELIGVMERHGHLRLPAEVRTRLLSISPSTVDRLLRPEREVYKTKHQHYSTKQSCNGQVKPDTFLGSVPIEFPLKIEWGLIA